MGVNKEEKLRAIRELVSLKSELLTQLQARGDAPRAVAAQGARPVQTRVSVEELLLLGGPTRLALESRRSSSLSADARPAPPGSPLATVAVEAEAELVPVLQRALREAQANERVATGAAATAHAQAEALREQVLELQSSLELERAMRVRAESQAALARSSLPRASATPPFAAPPALPLPAPSTLAAVSDWCQSFADLPAGGHWSMTADGGIWYTSQQLGAWKQAPDGSFGRSTSETPPAPPPPPLSYAW